MSRYLNANRIYDKINSNQISTDKNSYKIKYKGIQRSELLSPYLHELDEKSLQIGVKHYMAENPDKETEKILRKNGYTSSTIKKEVNMLFNKFPKTLINDIFNIKYRELSELEFKPSDNTNESRYKILNKASDSVIKVVSENNILNSFILTRSFVKNLIYKLIFLQDKKFDDFKELMNSLNGKEISNSDIISDLLEDNEKLDEISNQNDIETINKFNELVSKEKQEEMFRGISSQETRLSSYLLNPDQLDDVFNSYEEVNMNMAAVSHPISKLLDNSLSYFSYKTKIDYENIFDTDNLGGIEDWAYLHPKLRNIMIEDIQVKTEKKLGKIDIYVDTSGSMSGYVGIDKLSKYIFAKSFMYKLFKKDILKDIYVFDNDVHKVNKNVFDILNITCGGGTSLNNVVKSVIENKTNSIILTDAEDSCSLYSEYCFFIGVNGSSFSLFNKEVLKKYKENNQIIIFNGTKISYVK